MVSAQAGLIPKNARVFALVACGVLGGCGGTPTADPPDFLPTPSAGRIGVGPEVLPTGGPSTEGLGPIQLVGGEGAVDGQAELWIVNLDRLTEDPQVIRPRADGSFSAEVEGNLGDRVRLVSRTEDRHSLPLDLEVVRSAEVAALAALQDQGLACLKVAPAQELDLGSEPTREASFTLDNTCDADIVIERAALRFEEADLVLAAPSVVARGAQVDINLRLDKALSEERWDIVLLDVSAAGEEGRYALSVWAR